MTKAMSKRLLSVDRFRGILIFAMCFFEIAADFPVLGFISRFAGNSKLSKLMIMNNFPLADIEAPSFLFLISLSYFGSFKKRALQDKKQAYFHFIERYLIFMGLGSIMVSGEYLFVNGEADPLIIQTILMFVSAISLALGLLVKLFKLNNNYKDILFKILKYSLMILGLIGIILGIRDAIILFSGSDLSLCKHWSILHEIGFTGLLGLLVVNLKMRDKIVVWFSLLISYSLVLSFPGMIDLFDVIVFGGIAGTLGWLIVLLGGIILMEFFKNKLYKEYGISCIILAILAIILVMVMPINSSAVTPNFVLISLLIDVIVFTIISLLNNKEFKYDFLMWLGRNPLPIFFMTVLFRLIEKMWNPAYDTSFIIAFSYTFGTIGLNLILAYYLYKKDVIFKV